MTYEIYRYIFFGGAIAGTVMLLVTVILFFTLRIPKVISDLTGHGARKAIENIRRQNEASGDKSYQSSAVNLERGRLTDKISPSGSLRRNTETVFGTGVITEKISTQQLSAEAMDQTTVLDSGETTLLSGETSLLYEDTANGAPAEQQFVIEKEIVFVHTGEVIA